MGQEARTSEGVGRRTVLRRAGLTAGATVWATPVVQSLATPAFAAVSDPPPPIPGWGACLSGRGELPAQGPEDVTMRYQILEPICCNDLQGAMRVTVVLPSGDTREYDFGAVASALCDKELTCDDCPSAMQARVEGQGPGGVPATLDASFVNPGQPSQRTIPMVSGRLTVDEDDGADPRSYGAEGPAGSTVMSCSSC